VPSLDDDHGSEVVIRWSVHDVQLLAVLPGEGSALIARPVSMQDKHGSARGTARTGQSGAEVLRMLDVKSRATNRSQRAGTLNQLEINCG
jgi:hypothetical protein